MTSPSTKDGMTKKKRQAHQPDVNPATIVAAVIPTVVPTTRLITVARSAIESDIRAP
jgi:hypothetical protein